ncbi:MAG: hypothetical protein ACFFEA_04165 [Candidatus Thorarchaeota archaeon]
MIRRLISQSQIPAATRIRNERRRRSEAVYLRQTLVIRNLIRVNGVGKEMISLQIYWGK